MAMIAQRQQRSAQKAAKKVKAALTKMKKDTFDDLFQKMHDAKLKSGDKLFYNFVPLSFDK